jgi:gamma-glutamyltranspeptidase/glutathione hydrolase
VRIAKVEDSFEPTDDRKCGASANGMVASAFPEATQAGVEMLAQGGNVIDAACAVGFALSVCEPQASGIGGHGYGLIHFEGRTFAIDGSGRAPSLAHRDRVKVRALRIGHRGTTVPAIPALYGWLHQHYGRLDWPTVLEPAIRLARDGYLITQLQHAMQHRELEHFLKVGGVVGAGYFLRGGTEPYGVGETFKQSDLATTLDTLARHGAGAFYEGDIAAQIDADMRTHDGFLRADDLALVPWPVERPALGRRYRGLLVRTMPPPGAGRTLLLVLMMLNHLKSSFLATGDPNRHHFLAETFRKAFLQRTDRPYDANTFPQVKDKLMLSRKFAEQMAMTIADQMDATLPVEDPVGEDVGETTHFSAMDRDGNAVAMTQSIELVYGSKAAADGLGFLYNNYMLALELDNPAHPYYLRPNAVPWSSASPTIVFRNKEPWIAVGSPGSERIFSTVAQFLSGVIDGSQSIATAMHAPRFHCSIGGRIDLELARFSDAIPEHFRQLGYKLREREPFAFYLGCVQAVLRRQSGMGFQGVADIRRDGAAFGPQ